jgi:hypothetical protein
MDDNETLDSKRANFSFLGDCLGFGTFMCSTYDAKLYLKQAKNGLWCMYQDVSLTKGKVKKTKMTTSISRVPVLS